MYSFWNTAVQLLNCRDDITLKLTFFTICEQTDEDIKFSGRLLETRNISYESKVQVYFENVKSRKFYLI